MIAGCQKTTVFKLWCVDQKTKMITATIILSIGIFLGLPSPTSPLVRTLEVSPRVEANHDTFLYLCSLDVNEQNIGKLSNDDIEEKKIFIQVPLTAFFSYS